MPFSRFLPSSARLACSRKMAKSTATTSARFTCRHTASLQSTAMLPSPIFLNCSLRYSSVVVCPPNLQVLRAIGVNPTEVAPRSPPTATFPLATPICPACLRQSLQAELNEFKDPSVQGGGTVNFDELLQIYTCCSSSARLFAPCSHYTDTRRSRSPISCKSSRRHSK
jgi:hypothetical protein